MRLAFVRTHAGSCLGPSRRASRSSMALGSQTVILITFSNEASVGLSSTHACCGECRVLPATFAAMQNRPPEEAEIASGWPLARSGRSAGFPELARVVTSFFRAWPPYPHGGAFRRAHAHAASGARAPRVRVGCPHRAARGAPGDCPARSRRPERPSQHVNVEQTIVDSAGLAPYNATWRGRCLFVYCTHSPVLFATLYLPIFYAIWTKGSGMRAAVPEPHRNSAPVGAWAGRGPARAQPVWTKECPDPGYLEICSRGYLGRKLRRLT